jgi:hypothetical protein
MTEIIVGCTESCLRRCVMYGMEIILFRAMLLTSFCICCGRELAGYTRLCDLASLKRQNYLEQRKFYVPRIGSSLSELRLAEYTAKG